MQRWLLVGRARVRSGTLSRAPNPLRAFSIRPRAEEDDKKSDHVRLTGLDDFIGTTGTRQEDGHPSTIPQRAVEGGHGQQVATSRHLLRALLRETTYLPDSFARQWARQDILERFRKYGYKVWKHRDDAAFDERIRGKLHEARAALGLLRRANEGERKPLLKVLLMVYGRVGKRRHELMLPLLPAAGRDATMKLLHEASSSRPGNVSATEHPSVPPDDELASIEGAPEKKAKPSAAAVNKGAWTAYVPDFTPQLRALLQSQIRTPPPHLTRPLLRRMQPRLEELNTWRRPMPKVRVKNQTKQWYAELLERVHPPLPKVQWERLRELATGTQTDSLVPRRRSIVNTRPSALEMVVKYGKPPAKQAFGNQDAHKITPRYMQRIWAQVFVQCPVMDYDAGKMEWKVTWGEHALHGSGSRLEAGSGRRSRTDASDGHDGDVAGASSGGRAC